MMKPGEYYVGDLCYVIDVNHDNQNWNLVCDYICSDDPDGEFVQNFPAKDGSGEMVPVRFACYGTRWGDGMYEGSYGSYWVDSGTIGCISIEDLEKIEPIDREEMERLGAIVTFDHEFSTGLKRNSDDDLSVIKIGRIEIDTNPPYEEEEDEYDYYDDEDEDEALVDEY